MDNKASVSSHHVSSRPRLNNVHSVCSLDNVVHIFNGDRLLYECWHPYIVKGTVMIAIKCIFSVMDCWPFLISYKFITKAIYSLFSLSTMIFSPLLYFKYIKSRFCVRQNDRYKSRSNCRFWAITIGPPLLMKHSCGLFMLICLCFCFVCINNNWLWKRFWKVIMNL